MNKRQLIAGTAAAVLTFGSAAAAIALNVGAASTNDSSPAGKLIATESLAPAPAATPSTIYVDVTVPDLPPGSAPVTDAGSSTSGNGSGSGTAVVSPRGSGSAPSAGVVRAGSAQDDEAHESPDTHPEGGGDDD